jgi:hypothetical protein
VLTGLAAIPHFLPRPCKQHLLQPCRDDQESQTHVPLHKGPSVRVCERFRHSLDITGTDWPEYGFETGREADGANLVWRPWGGFESQGKHDLLRTRFGRLAADVPPWPGVHPGDWKRDVLLTEMLERRFVDNALRRPGHIAALDATEQRPVQAIVSELEHVVGEEHPKYFA